MSFPPVPHGRIDSYFDLARKDEHWKCRHVVVFFVNSDLALASVISDERVQGGSTATSKGLYVAERNPGASRWLAVHARGSYPFSIHPYTLHARSTITLHNMSFWLQAALFLVLGHRTMALLFPLPQTVTSGNTVIAIGNSLDVIFNVQGSIPEDLAAAAERAVGCVIESEHYYLSPERGKEFLLDNVLPVLTALGIILQGSDYGTIASEVSKEASERREAYELDIPADGGTAKLTATSSLGAFRGLVTFEQLFYGVPVSTCLIRWSIPAT